jgi:hypothetical protein
MKTVNSKFTTPSGVRSDVAAGPSPQGFAQSSHVRKRSGLLGLSSKMIALLFVVFSCQARAEQGKQPTH